MSCNGTPFRLHWDLHELEPEGYHALCQRVGSTVMTMLTQAHPAEFAKFPLLVPPMPSEFDTLRCIIDHLMFRSTKEKTTAYISALDAIFVENATELGRTSLPEAWSVIRGTLIERYGP